MVDIKPAQQADDFVSWNKFNLTVSMSGHHLSGKVQQYTIYPHLNF